MVKFGAVHNFGKGWQKKAKSIYDQFDVQQS